MLELLLDLTRRALEGFVFAAPCVGIWFLGLRFHKKAPPFAHMLAAFGLCLYLSGVLAVTGIGKPFGFFPRISLVREENPQYPVGHDRQNHCLYDLPEAR